MDENDRKQDCVAFGFCFIFVWLFGFIHALNASSCCSRALHNFAIDLVGHSCGGVNVNV